MKAGTSSLNPYAASYIPLSRRGAVDETKGYESTVTDSRSGNQAVWLGHYPVNTTQNQYPKYSHDYDALASPQSPDTLTMKNHSLYGSYGSSSQGVELAGKQALDDDYDMNLAYLQMTFPGISDESLSGVYTANRGDMEATVDMLNQLELYSGDFSENLPDSLDIGDVSEAGSSNHNASQKQKKVAGEGDNVAGPWVQSLPPK